MSISRSVAASEPFSTVIDGRLWLEPVQAVHGETGTTARLATVLPALKVRSEAVGGLPRPLQAVRKPESPGCTTVRLTATALTFASALTAPSVNVIGSVSVPR